MPGSIICDTSDTSQPDRHISPTNCNYETEWLPEVAADLLCRPTVTASNSNPVLTKLATQTNCKGSGIADIKLALGANETNTILTVDLGQHSFPISPVQNIPKWSSLISSEAAKELNISKKVSFTNDVSVPQQKHLWSMGPLPES